MKRTLLIPILIAPALICLLEHPASSAPKPAAAKRDSSPAATVASSQAEALKKYPDLGKAGSAFNLEFVALVKRYQAEKPDFFKDAAWPLKLADQLAETAAKRAPASAVSNNPSVQPSSIPAQGSPAPAPLPGVLYDVNFSKDEKPKSWKIARVENGALQLFSRFYEDPELTDAIIRIPPLKLTDMTLAIRCKLERGGMVFGLGAFYGRGAIHVPTWWRLEVNEDGSCAIVSYGKGYAQNRIEGRAGSIPSPIGSWHTFAISFGGKEEKAILSVDGREVAQQSLPKDFGPEIKEPKPYYENYYRDITFFPNGGGPGTKGKVSHIRAYDHALSAADLLNVRFLGGPTDEDSQGKPAARPFDASKFELEARAACNIWESKELFIGREIGKNNLELKASPGGIVCWGKSRTAGGPEKPFVALLNAATGKLLFCRDWIEPPAGISEEITSAYCDSAGTMAVASSAIDNSTNDGYYKINFVNAKSGELLKGESKFAFDTLMPNESGPSEWTFKDQFNGMHVYFLDRTGAPLAATRNGLIEVDMSKKSSKVITNLTTDKLKSGDWFLFSNDSALVRVHPAANAGYDSTVFESKRIPLSGPQKGKMLPIDSPLFAPGKKVYVKNVSASGDEKLMVISEPDDKVEGQKSKLSCLDYRSWKLHWEADLDQSRSPYFINSDGRVVIAGFTSFLDGSGAGSGALHIKALDFKTGRMLGAFFRDYGTSEGIHTYGGVAFINGKCVAIESDRRFSHFLMVLQPDSQPARWEKAFEFFKAPGSVIFEQMDGAGFLAKFCNGKPNSAIFGITPKRSRK